MRLNRSVATIAAGALMGLVPITLASSPAYAADNTTVTTLSAMDKVIQYKGYSPYLNAAVKTSGGSSVYTGTVTLLGRTATSGWSTLRTADASGYISFDVIPQQNTQYRVVYSGGSEYGDTYQASQSSDLLIGVYRKMVVKNPRGTLFKGKISPKYAKKKILVQKKVGKKWKKFRTLKTNKGSRFSVTLPAQRKRTNFRLVAPGNKQFIGTQLAVWTQRY